MYGLNKSNAFLHLGNCYRRFFRTYLTILYSLKNGPYLLKHCLSKALSHIDRKPLYSEW
jgi:hypothetical protein